jgi:hypothetical protein
MESNLKIEYLRKYKFIFKKALAHESGDPGVLFAEQKPRVENLVRLSLLSDPVTRFLSSGFLHQTTPSRLLSNRLKPFCIWLFVHGNI